MYIGNRVYNANFEGGIDQRSTLPKGTIQAVDISDPAGDLVEGAEIRINGQIDNRWQMDEHEGVLRVLSQYSQWRSDAVPRLETFQVVSSNEFTKLGDLELTLPRPEVLQSVRFDGDRAYAITFERTDPLFTFDLSDPAAPKQVGVLEIPGWVYHMEPRGDRLYGVGFDNDVEGGALHVSLFDVSDLAAPTMLARVNFGGDWASLAEDQDRIHKSFKLFDEAGLIVVPFSGWGKESESDCWGQYKSGVQLIDYDENALTLRGVAPQVGEARRAFIHRNHLFGTGDDAVQTFDISDRDAPKKIDTLEVARNVSTVRVIGDRVLRFGNDWWTDRAVLDIVPAAHADDPTAGTAIDLSELVKDDREVCDANRWQNSYWGNVYAQGNFAYIERHVLSATNNQQTDELKFFVLDITEGKKPAVVSEFSTDITNAYRGENNESEYFTGTLMTDSALLVGRARYSYNRAENNQRTPKTQYSYDIFDIRSGKAPEFVQNFKVPEIVANQGWGRPVMGCGMDYGWGWGGYGYGEQQGSLVSGDIIASTHSEELKDGSARARMYLDRVDVSDPAKPQMLPPLNVPGEAIHYDHKSGKVVTLEYDVTTKKLSDEKCWNAGENHYFTGEECRYFERRLNVLSIKDDQATRVAQTRLDATGAGRDWYMSSLSVTNERIFISQFRPGADRNERDERLNATRVYTTEELTKLGTIEEPPGWSWGGLRARGTRAFSNRDGGELTVYDASSSGEPVVSRHTLKGWGCESLEVRGDTAYCAEGKKGVHLFDLK